jgi:hypothetical protein
VESTVQRFKLIALTVLSVLVLTIVGVTFISPVHATLCDFAPSLSSSSIVQGSSLTLSVLDSGCDSGINPPAFIYFQVFTGSCPTGPNFTPTGTAVSSLATISFTGDGTYTASVNGDGSGNNFGPGSYCVNVYSTLFGVSENGVDVAFNVTSATPIPEYPFGVAVLAILAVIAYGLIKRRTGIQKR